MLTSGIVVSQPVRRAARAGSWYPGDPSVLAREIDGYGRLAGGGVSGSIDAIVAPHAGLAYSGPVAAFAYEPLRGRSYDAVVLVGPSHFVAFSGTAIVRRGAFATPLGLLPIDETLADALCREAASLHERPEAHAQEHSLEMQLPFLARVLPGVPIVPLVMGRRDPATVDDLAGALSRAAGDRRVLLIASSDLSHYHEAREAARLDGVVVRALEMFDEEALARALDRFPDHACGGGPMLAVMRGARARGANGALVRCRRDSGDVSGDTRAVVGYVAALFGHDLSA